MQVLTIAYDVLLAITSAALTYAAVAYAAFIAVDFVSGLIQLWKKSAVTENTTLGSQKEISEIADPWDLPLEPQSLAKPECMPWYTFSQLMLPPAKEVVEDLTKLTVAELRKKAQALKVKGARAMKKKDLIAALS